MNQLGKMRKNLSVCNERVQTKYFTFEIVKLSNGYGVALTLRDGTVIFQDDHRDELSAVNAVFLAHKLMEVLVDDDDDGENI